MKWRQFEQKIISYIEKNPQCTRKDVYNTLYKKEYGKRGIFSKNIGTVISKLAKQGRLIESNIVRKNQNISSSNLILPNQTQDVIKIVRRRPKKDIATRLQKKATLLQKSMYKHAIEHEKKVIETLDNPKKIIEIEKELDIGHQTIYNILTRLRSRGIVLQDPETKRWILTKIGDGIRKEYCIMDRKRTDGDNFYLHIPFLIKAHEKFTVQDIAERAHGFLGHYYKQGISDEPAIDDLINKIEKHLLNSMVCPFIRPIPFKKFEVDCSEETLNLWRLESLIKTVLYKSGEKKIGFSVFLYDKLVNLLRKEFIQVEEKIKDLPEKEQYVIWLMLNGVQLETILPPYEIVSKTGESIKDKITQNGFPIKTYSENTADEATLIEE